MEERCKVLNSLGGLIKSRRRSLLYFTIIFATSMIILLEVYTRFNQPKTAISQKYTFASKNTIVQKAVADVKSTLLKTIESIKKRIGPTLKIQRLSTVNTENCTKIPLALPGQRWAEEEFIYDPKPTDVRELVDPKRSRVWLKGPSTVTLGDYIRLRIDLYDGFGKKKLRGGDLVRVWTKEDSLGASSNGHVVDFNNGSYVATLQAMWVGKPNIRVFVISPREVIAVQFKRRYLCPPILTNTAVFVQGSKGLETPCNVDPHVPGYPELCNLTELNYGQSWFCGKPRSPEYTCNDWEMSADIFLPIDKIRPTVFTPLENNIIQKQYSSRPIPHNITLVIHEGDFNQTRIAEEKPCNEVDKASTWQATPPRGYMFKKIWQNSHCSIQLTTEQIYACLNDTDVVLIGDSTTNQLYEAFMRKVPCKKQKQEGVCVNKELNFNLISQQHMLPFCTAVKHRTNFRSFSQYMEEIESTQKTILILHTFAHQKNYQSHVFRETLSNMKHGIRQLLQRHHNVFIVIKGPHSYAINKDSKTIMWMPDKYADIYQEMIFEVLSKFKDKVMYLDCMDITVSTEQWFIHPEDYIVGNMVTNILGHACSSK